MKVNVWIVPTGDLTGQYITADLSCTAVNSGYAYFYIPGTPKDYRSISGVPLSTGMGWVTLALSNIAPQDFVRFDGKSGWPDLTNADGLGITFWVDSTLGLGTQYMEVDDFVVTPEPPTLLMLAGPYLLLSRLILRRRKGRPQA